MLKIIFKLILIGTLMTGVVGCDNNDDFAPYTNYDKELDISISGYQSCIFDITDEVTQIAQKYTEGVELTYAIIIFKDAEQIAAQQGNIQFDFYKEHETKNQITRVLLNYNMSTHKVDKLNFEQGHGKRVGGRRYAINEELSKVSISQLITDLYSDTQFQEKIRFLDPLLEIGYTNEINIYIYGHSKNKIPIYRKTLTGLS